jgi:hypothetical protein
MLYESERAEGKTSGIPAGKPGSPDPAPVDAALVAALADPALTDLVRRWATLPDHIRAAIVALAQISGR